MALTYPDYADVDSERFEQLLEILRAVVQSYNPSIDLRRGAVHDLVMQPRALLAAVEESAVLDALQASSLSAIVADPTIADTEATDRTLANYRLVRRPSVKATGSIGVVIDSLTPVVVSEGAVFVVSGVSFATTKVFAARTDSDAVVSDSDRLMTAVSGGYVFLVDVEAVEAGSSGNVRRGTTATTDDEPFGFVRAYANADFTGGEDQESNTDLMNRWAAGLAVRAWSNRPSIEAVMRAQEDFAALEALSIIGFGDAEMLRDRHLLFPGSVGGRADAYVRTAETFRTEELSVTATLISKVGAVGTWQFGIGRDDAPGYYDVTSVLIPTQDPFSSGFALSSEVRSADLSGGEWTPDIPVAVEAVYSRYQASVCQFVDTVTNATNLTVNVATATYTVLVRTMPLIGDVQDFWNLLDNRPPSGDILIKAPVPCFVSVSLTLNVKRGSTIDSDSVSREIAKTINAASFVSQLASSLIGQAVHNLLGDALVSTTGVSMVGSLRRPDGTTTTLSSGSSLAVPDDPAGMVTSRTVCFLTEPSSIAPTVNFVDA